MNEFDASSYLAAVVEREQTLLQAADERGRHVYCLSRAWAAELAGPEVAEILEEGRQPRVLEVGCGVGKAVEALLDSNPGLQSSSVVATALNRLDEHAALEQRGVDVRIGVIAESLPSDFRGQFDVVMASVVMQWTEPDRAVPELYEALSPNGVLLGFDTRPDVARVERVAAALGMVNALSDEVKAQWEMPDTNMVPFALRKG